MKPGTSIGALVGALLTAPLIAVFYLGWKLGGLPFAPFDLFDWVTRRLPGSIVTIGIDLLVKIIRALDLGSTDTAAKAAEQLMGIAGFFIAGVVAGAVLFAILRVRDGTSAYSFGGILGALSGVGVVLISQSVNRSATTSPLVSGLWILAAFLTWGAAFGWVHSRLSTGSTMTAEAEDSGGAFVERIDRRRFLIRLGGATAVITVGGSALGALIGSRRMPEVAATERWSATHTLPNVRVAVKPAAGTRAEFTPLEEHYRIDINALPPVIKEEGWRLKVSGLVEGPVELTLADLRDYPPMHQFITLSCISNLVAGDLIGTTRWTGVSLQRLLPDLRLRPTATHLKITSADSFYEVVALETINGDERVMLAYAWDGVPLTTHHGFPLRIYIPDLYGMKQPKWIESIEATDRWEEGYWVTRTWDREARMKATSVIDTIAVDEKITDAGGRRLVPVGGIAHAGTRGISKVEVRVNDGEWREAQLRSPLSGATWVIWRYDWPFQGGRHTFSVRCNDGTGALQVAAPSEPHPSGATGLHRRGARL
ncbi:MAG: molybdopterin-dependent oxidoreductase [Armatimonadota bacterium]